MSETKKKKGLAPWRTLLQLGSSLSRPQTISAVLPQTSPNCKRITCAANLPALIQLSGSSGMCAQDLWTIAQAVQQWAIVVHDLQCRYATYSDGTGVPLL